MINDALAKFVPETTCLINHRNNDVIVHEIKETVAKIFDKIDELTKAVIRLDYRNREEI